MADLVEQHGDELAALEALNNGKAVTIARNVDVKAAVDVLRCVSFQEKRIRWYGPIDSESPARFCVYVGIMVAGRIRFTGKRSK